MDDRFHLYPKIEITKEMVRERADLEPFVGKELTVIAWLWARTVKSPNPAFADVKVPLVSTFMLSAKEGREVHVEPVIEGRGYRFSVKLGKPRDEDRAQRGTRAGKAQDFLCLMSNVPIERSYVRDEGKAGRLGTRLMAVIAEGPRGKIYLSPTASMEIVARCDAEMGIVDDARTTFLSGPTPTRAMITGGVCSAYGLSTWGHLFTDRQLLSLTTFSDLVQDVRERAKRDALAGGLSADPKPLDDGGTGALAYADAVAVYLAFAIDRLADYNSSIATWKPSGEQVMQTYKRQAIPMTWDFPESNVFSDSAICWKNCVKYSADNLEATGRIAGGVGFARLADAGTQSLSQSKVISTDPPYYDNIGYADLSDFFYVWLRRSLKPIFPDLFATLTTPKAEELVATPYRHGSQEKAETFFLEGMTRAMHRLAEQAHPAFPVTIYYAFKQAETEKAGTASTGWETFLEAVIQAGFALTGTWPMRTELSNRMVSAGTNALASSIILVCRPRRPEAPTVTRREFLAALKAELPAALANLQRGNIAPVDLAQAAVGPGMAIYTRYSRVIDAEGKTLSVREALALINQILDEVLAQQEGDFDVDTRWALSWFEQFGFDGGEYGMAETLSNAKNTSVAGLVEAGIIASKAGRVRLLKPTELPEEWDPETDERLTVWEMVHHLVRVLEGDGEPAAAKLVAKLAANAETARELAYRLYALCDRKKRAPLAGSYNGLVQSWPELSRLAREDAGKAKPAQGQLFGKE